MCQIFVAFCGSANIFKLNESYEEFTAASYIK